MSDGYFSAVLSAERPAGYDGDWWELAPGTRRLLMRNCACDWTHEIDARVAIERLDDGGADMTPEEIARRFSDLAAWVEGMIGFDMQLVRYYREHHGVNTFLRSTKIDEMGGLPKQAYYDGIHEIDDDEALIVETALPETCRYWQMLVADDRFCTVDWVNRQSSLNDAQAHVDSDGKFRAVISHRDPACPIGSTRPTTRGESSRCGGTGPATTPTPRSRRCRWPRCVITCPADTPVVTPGERGSSCAADARAPSCGGSGSRPPANRPRFCPHAEAIPRRFGGCGLAYAPVRRRRESAMTMVLVHGGGLGKECWDPLLPFLDGDVLAIDLPGRGDRPRGSLDHRHRRLRGCGRRRPGDTRSPRRRAGGSLAGGADHPAGGRRGPRPDPGARVRVVHRPA